MSMNTDLTNIADVCLDGLEQAFIAYSADGVETVLPGKGDTRALRMLADELHAAGLAGRGDDTYRIWRDALDDWDAADGWRL